MSPREQNTAPTPYEIKQRDLDGVRPALTIFARALFQINNSLTKYKGSCCGSARLFIRKEWLRARGVSAVTSRPPHAAADCQVKLL